MVFLSDEKHLIPYNLKKGDWKNERKNKVARADTGQEIRPFLPFSPDCIVTFFCPLYTLLREWFAGPPARFNFGILVALSPWIRLIVGLRYALPPSTGCVRNILPWKKWSRVQKETSPFPEIETILENPFSLYRRRETSRLTLANLQDTNEYRFRLRFPPRRRKYPSSTNWAREDFSVRGREEGGCSFFFLQKSKVFDESLGGRIYTFQTPRVQIIVGRSSGTYLPLVRRDFIRGSGRDLLIWGQIPLEDEMRGAAEVVVLQEGWHVWWLFATQLSPPTDSNSKTPPVYGVYFLVDTAAFDPIHFTFFSPIESMTLFSNFYILNNYNLPCNLSSSSSFTSSVERYV